MSTSRSHVILSIALILIGCCLNVIDLEFITKADPGAGVLVTCAQFVFIASEGFLQHYRAPFGLIPRSVPLSVYLKLTIVFFIMSVINNQALAFSISMPVHTVFRSSSLAASLFLGMTIYHKKYTRTQILSCLLVTFGIMIITLADATLPKECCGGNTHGSNTTSAADTEDKEGSLLESTRWLIGICMLTLALLMSAYLGHEQDSIFMKYGKNWKEMLFYTHLLSLPAFVVTWENIKQHIYTWITCPPVTLFTLSGYGPISVSLTWLLIGNLLTQMVCVRGVYMLTSSSGALTATLIITLRKFISLIISIVYFANPFTVYHWFGTLLVFIGLCTYSYPYSSSTSTSTPRKVYAPTPSPSVMRADDGSDPTSVNGTYHDEDPEPEQDQQQEQDQEIMLQPVKPRRGRTLSPPTTTRRITRSMSRTRTEESVNSAVASTTTSTRTPSKRRTRKDSS